MRHNKAINHLGRQSGHRKAMLANMASSLIMHKRITTTVAKAKALRSYVEPLITKSKEDTTHSRRVVFSYLKDKNAVTELFRNIAPKIADRPGGYTRVLHIGFRQGDAAEMALIELVDFNEAALASATKSEQFTSPAASDKQSQLKILEERARKAREEADEAARRSDLENGYTGDPAEIAESLTKRTAVRSISRESVRRGFIWGKVIDEPRFKKRWTAYSR